MGNCIRPQQCCCILSESCPTLKEGIYYEDCLPYLKPLDLVFFKGGDYVSKLICFLEKTQMPSREIQLRQLVQDGGAADIFSHVGIVVTAEILEHPSVETGKWYIWESTMSGPLNDGVPNILGQSYLGVQLRDLSEVIRAYDAKADTRVAMGCLTESVRSKLLMEHSRSLRERFTEVFNDYDGIRYDANIISLCSSLCRCCRGAREIGEYLLDTEDWLFCSELVAVVYKDLGIFPAKVNPKNVVPMDFLGCDADTSHDGGVPPVIQLPTYYVTATRYEWGQ